MVAATGVAAVVGVVTVEVVVAVVATVGVVTRSLRRQRAEVSVVMWWRASRDGLHAGKGGGDDCGDMTAIVLPGRDEKKKTKTKKNLSKCLRVGLGPAAAVGGAAVRVVAVVAASGRRREQVADVQATGSVRSRFRRRQGLARLEGVWGQASGGACVCVGGTARLWPPLSCDGSS